MEDHQPAVQVAGEGGAHVKCVGGLVELVRKISKILWWLAKNWLEKKKERRKGR